MGIFAFNLGPLFGQVPCAMAYLEWLAFWLAQFISSATIMIASVVYLGDSWSFQPISWWEHSHISPWNTTKLWKMSQLNAEKTLTECKKITLSSETSFRNCKQTTLRHKYQRNVRCICQINTYLSRVHSNALPAAHTRLHGEISLKWDKYLISFLEFSPLGVFPAAAEAVEARISLRELSSFIGQLTSIWSWHSHSAARRRRRQQV